MRFTTSLVALLTSSALASPVTRRDPDGSEPISIKNFSVWKAEDGVTLQSVYFQLTGANATDTPCQLENPVLVEPTLGGDNAPYTNCEADKYRFKLTKGKETEFGLVVVHELATAFGWWGTTDAFAVCRAGGLGRWICNQPPQTTPIEFSIALNNPAAE